MNRRQPARRQLAVATATLALLASGCAAPQQSTVPKVTVGGTPDSQRSLAPDEVLGARQQAGIEDCPTSDLDAKAVEGGLPAITLDCLGGDTTVNLAGLPTGRPRVVNLWAQWCQPCTTEAPYFGEVAAQAKGKVDFLGIDYDDPFAGKVVDFAVRTRTTYPHVVDREKKTRGPLRVVAVPQTYFVDAQGRLVHHETSFYTSADDLRADITQYLGVQL